MTSFFLGYAAACFGLIISNFIHKKDSVDNELLGVIFGISFLLYLICNLIGAIQ